MKETKSKKDSTVVENTFFRFVSFNIPNLHLCCKIIKFKYSELLKGSLMKGVIYDKSHSKEYHQYRTSVGIRTGQISVMRLGKKAKFNQYIIFLNEIEIKVN